MAPPAKKQKKLVVLSSDDEELDAKSTHKPASTTFRAKPIRSNTGRSSLAIQPDPSILPKDHAAKPKFTDKAHTSKPISSFFGSETQARQPNSQKSLGAVTSEVQDHEDLIVDDSPIESVDDLNGTTARTAVDRQKKHQGSVHENATATNRTRLLGGGQKFKYPQRASSIGVSPGISGVPKKNSGAIESKIWAEKYGPNNLEELMVHKKKVSDVRDWLDKVVRVQDRKVRLSRTFAAGQPLIVRKRLLILKGPSGTGKTATISMLAKSMKLDVSEWKNPVGSQVPSEAYLSMSAHFEDFLSRSRKFNRLVLADMDGSFSATPLPTIGALSENTRGRIILMEEFPSTFLSTSSALRSFRSCISQYLAFRTPSLNAFTSRKQGGNQSVTPVIMIMIITETRLTTSTAANDSFTAYRLLGPELLDHPGVSTIEFNPIASTYLTKALDLVIQKEARQSGRRRIPGPTVLKKLGEVGDIRSAIGSLEFLCLRGEDRDDWGGRVASRARKGAIASPALTKMETESLEMVTQRESTLGLFHSVGKVVYNKRGDFADVDAVSEPPTQPQHRLSRRVRPRVTQVSPDQLIDETGTDISTFIAALHENFVLSCEGNSFANNLDGCMDALSDSDILGSPRGDRFGSSGDYRKRAFLGATSDILRQDEICFQVAVRGLLFALPDPVKRRTDPTSGNCGGKSDSYRMFYPTSMRVSRQMEEIGGLVDQWRLRAHSVPLGNTMSRQGQQITHWHLRQEVTARHRSQFDEDGQEPFRTRLGCTKSELVVEMLPYIAKIEQRNATSASPNGLERITRFYGITPLGNEALDDEDVREGVSVSDWTTDSPAEGNVTCPSRRASLRQGNRQARKSASTLVLPVEEEEVGQLYLSDDDIEDDWAR